MKTTKFILIFAIFFIGIAANSYSQKSLLELKGREIIKKYAKLKNRNDESALKLFEKYYKKNKSKILEPDTIYILQGLNLEWGKYYGTFFNKEMKINYTIDYAIQRKKSNDDTNLIIDYGKIDRLEFVEEYYFEEELFPLIFNWDINKIRELEEKYPIIGPTTVVVKRIIIHNGVKIDSFTFDQFGYSFDE